MARETPPLDDSHIVTPPDGESQDTVGSEGGTDPAASPRRTGREPEPPRSPVDDLDPRGE